MAYPKYISFVIKTFGLQKCSIFVVAGVFFLESTKNHYLLEIGRKAKLAHTAVSIHQQGEDREDSDIGLFVNAEKEEVHLEMYEQQLQRKLQLHIQKHFKRYPPKLKNNITNGMVLHSYLEVF
mgnify:CR=1 FL=1